MNYIKKWIDGIRTSYPLHSFQRSTTYAISVVAIGCLNDIYEQVNVYSAGTNF